MNDKQYNKMIAIMSEPNWKQRYRDKAKELGIAFGGYDAEQAVMFFQQGNYADGFNVINCYPDEVFDGSLELMIKHGVSR